VLMFVFIKLLRVQQQIRLPNHGKNERKEECRKTIKDQSVFHKAHFTTSIFLFILSLKNRYDP
jgi:hypothetical protein